MLSEANLSEALLVRADLNGADLRWARLDRANLREADLTSCRVHGLSACNVELDQSKQSNLILSDGGESVTIDHLEMAQFIYLTQNTHIGDLFDSIILLVGQFSGRANLLNALKMNLRTLRYIPVSFDLDTSTGIESCVSIARLARFLLVDLTNVKNISPLIQTVISQRVLPIQPLFDISQKKRIRCPDFDLSPWVLPVYRYRGQAHLSETFKESVIEPAEEMARQWWEVKAC